MARFTTLDECIDSLYRSVSGPAGPRDWTDERLLFHEAARLTRMEIGDDGRPRAAVFCLEEWIENTEAFLRENDFWEVETARTVHRFGAIAQVLSVYEARSTEDAPEPERRGVNLIQLVHDGERWWVMSIIWDNERDGVEVPDAWTA